MIRWPRCLVKDCPNLPPEGRTLCRPCRRRIGQQLRRTRWVPGSRLGTNAPTSAYGGGRGSVHGTGKGVSR